MTVIRWVEEGRLRAFKTVGGHRRIVREDLESFCRQRRIPFGDDGEVEARPMRILLAMSAREAGELEGSVRAAAPEAVLAVASTAFEAGLEIGRQPPDVVIIGATPPVEITEVRGLVGRGSGGQRAIRVVAVGGEAALSLAMAEAGATVLDPRPSAAMLQSVLGGGLGAVLPKD